MQMSSPTRRNHMGRMWIPPSSSSVARLAMSVLERRSWISVSLRTGGLFAAASGEWSVISFLQQLQLLPVALDDRIKVLGMCEGPDLGLDHEVVRNCL